MNLSWQDACVALSGSEAPVLALCQPNVVAIEALKRFWQEDQKSKDILSHTGTLRPAWTSLDSIFKISNKEKQPSWCRGPSIIQVSSPTALSLNTEVFTFHSGIKPLYKLSRGQTVTGRRVRMFWVPRNEEQKLRRSPKADHHTAADVLRKAEAKQSGDWTDCKEIVCHGQKQQDVPQHDIPKEAEAGDWTSKVSACPTKPCNPLGKINNSNVANQCMWRVFIKLT